MLSVGLMHLQIEVAAADASKMPLLFQTLFYPIKMVRESTFLLTLEHASICGYRDSFITFC